LKPDDVNEYEIGFFDTRFRES